MECSKRLQAYFNSLEKECKKAFEVASKARVKGFDPHKTVEISLAKNMAERVIGIISVVAPQIVGKGAENRIIELEKMYGTQDWRVGLKIAEDVAKEKFCKFKDKKEAMEIGIRTGFTYVTVGVVSSPLEGFTRLDIKERMDGKGQYFCLNYAGPVRNAGGTAAAVSVLIGDYIRKKFGYAVYDPTEKEKKRTFTELEDYHAYIANLQYFPSKQEVEFMMDNLPVEISGDPSEKYKVSNINYHDLPRVPTNLLRSGFCLIHSSCIPLKAPKLHAQLSKWGAEFDLEHWAFLDEFLTLQKKAKAKGKKKDSKLSPDYTYIKDLVAGRPVLGHPLSNGSFRLRYGRSRASGFSAQSIHPATMIILDDFVATATQLKVERPGKAAAYSPCDTIDGPIVLLNNGSVVFVDTVALAKKIHSEIKEILYLGDVLINYGDFFDRAHPLIPAGYCPEFWGLELEEKIKQHADKNKASQTITTERINDLLSAPLTEFPSFEEAVKLSEQFDVPLHSRFTPFWNSITKEQFERLLEYLSKAKTQENKLIIPYVVEFALHKRALELLGIPHHLINNENVVVDGDAGKLLNYLFFKKKAAGSSENNAPTEAYAISVVEAKAAINESDDVLSAINKISKVKIRDKLGIFIGSRMGRPEKAKMRKMVGSPHTLFPVGTEGGRLRSFQAALEKKIITAEFPLYHCNGCNKYVVYNICPFCNKEAAKKNYCTICGITDDCVHDIKQTYKKQEIEIEAYFTALLKKLKTKIYPDLIKGVKGTSNKNHVPEHLIKGILRSKHNIYVNKDGTTRYDCSELTLTHFKPKEISVPIEKLKELGYTEDIHGVPLENTNQVLELLPQDIVIPCFSEGTDDPADNVLYNVANFIDELLYKHYRQKPYYGLTSKQDLVGQLVIGLAPHTSAGILGRIVGFSNTQAFLAHPYYHAAMRRDCDGDESCFFLLMDGFLNFSKEYLPSSRGSTMDAPIVLTYLLDPAEVDDMAFHVDIAWKYPLELYRAAQKYKMPWDVKIPLINDTLGTEKQFEGMGFTHDTDNLNAGVVYSSYKRLPSMKEKLAGQMALATKIRAVDESDVARLVIEKHFIRDIKGNLRKFSQQQFRCVTCNEKFRRPPLKGVCDCGGKILFTISEGSIIKYLDPSLSLADKYSVPDYLKQSLDLTKRRIEAVFGKEKETQEGLGRWFG